ncbi:hypothetical protein [Xenorhabdus bovienii]|uniref:Uncharacterized protein n=1 Tax=Xenorhabdus bovienii str. Intermedium TaxID=1379677 RepID=A0A077QJ74_XENBV|nr:hypothetical protein [Xenorhabdus bovienii]CDH33253.1 hypothetical protein XBI1_2510018 [Xenorhabdus bovienii str. Intermedium]
MKVTIEMNNKEVQEYIGGDYLSPEFEYQSLIQNDAKVILENSGFQGIETGDITVTITHD